MDDIYQMVDEILQIVDELQPEFRAPESNCRRRNSPGFDPSILRHNIILGASFVQSNRGKFVAKKSLMRKDVSDLFHI